MVQNRVGKFIEKLNTFPPWLRKLIGITFIAFGLVGFLPIVGFWMIPLGLIVLSADYRFARYIHVNARLLKRRLTRKKRASNLDA